MGTVLGLTDDVRKKLQNAKAMREQTHTRAPRDPRGALDYAKATARKMEEAMSPSGNDDRHDFIDHEKRIAHLETRADGGDKTGDDLWTAVGEIQKSVAAINVNVAVNGTTGAATLKTTEAILVKMEKFEQRAADLDVTHAQVKTGLNILMTIAASIGAAVSGVITFVVTHFISGPSSPSGHP